jgi:hypothetical protein
MRSNYQEKNILAIVVIYSLIYLSKKIICVQKSIAIFLHIQTPYLFSQKKKSILKQRKNSLVVSLTFPNSEEFFRIANLLIEISFQVGIHQFQ